MAINPTDKKSQPSRATILRRHMKKILKTPILKRGTLIQNKKKPKRKKK